MRGLHELPMLVVSAACMRCMASASPGCVIYMAYTLRYFSQICVRNAACMSICKHRPDQQLPDRSSPQEDGGTPYGQLLVNSLADLLRKRPCRQCLVWCKADVVVEQLHEKLPNQLLGYVAMPAEADRAGLPPFRLAFPQVRSSKECTVC